MFVIEGTNLITNHIVEHKVLISQSINHGGNPCFVRKKQNKSTQANGLVYEDLVEGKNGRVAKFNRVKTNDFVEVIPILKDGSLLMVKNYRYGIKSDILELPAGHIEKNERPAKCAKRELLEETGYTCKKLIPKGWVYVWPARSHQKIYVFVAKCLELTSDQKLDDFEFAKVTKLHRNQVARKMRNGQIKNPYSIAALMLAGL